MSNDWLLHSSHDFDKGRKELLRPATESLCPYTCADRPTSSDHVPCRVRSRSRNALDRLLDDWQSGKGKIDSSSPCCFTIGSSACIMLLHPPLDRKIVFAQGPVLRTEEGQEGAVLCNDDESLSCASRENSLADCGLLKQNSFEAVQSK